MIADIDMKPAVHDRVLVEAHIDGRLTSFRAVAVNILPTALWLGLVGQQPQLEQLRRDQPLQLTFRRDNTGMIAASSFIGHLGASRTRLFSVSWPDDVKLMCRPVFLHRLVCRGSSDRSVNGHAARILDGILGAVPVPV